jgi:hypothetical protein
VFTAPVSGMYVFSWTQNVEHRDYQSTELVVDGKTLAWAYADTAGDSAEDDYGSSSQTVVVKVINTRCVRTMYVLVTIINLISSCLISNCKFFKHKYQYSNITFILM